MKRKQLYVLFEGGYGVISLVIITRILIWTDPLIEFTHFLQFHEYVCLRIYWSIDLVGISHTDSQISLWAHHKIKSAILYEFMHTKPNSCINICNFFFFFFFIYIYMLISLIEHNFWPLQNIWVSLSK